MNLLWVKILTFGTQRRKTVICGNSVLENSDSSDSSYWSIFLLELFILLPHWANIRLGRRVKVKGVLSWCSPATRLPWEQLECAWLATLWLLKHAWLCKSSVRPGMSLRMPPQRCTNENAAATTSQQQQHRCRKGYKLCSFSFTQIMGSEQF